MATDIYSHAAAPHVFGTTPRIKKSGSAISQGLVATLEAVASDLVAVPQSLKTCGCPEKGPEGFFSRKPQAKCPLTGPNTNRLVVLRRGLENCCLRKPEAKSNFPARTSVWLSKY